MIYVTNQDHHDVVSIIKADSLIITGVMVIVGHRPQGLAVNSSTKKINVAN